MFRRMKRNTIRRTSPRPQQQGDQRCAVRCVQRPSIFLLLRKASIVPVQTVEHWWPKRFCLPEQRVPDLAGERNCCMTEQRSASFFLPRQLRRASCASKILNIGRDPRCTWSRFSGHCSGGGVGQSCRSRRPLCLAPLPLPHPRLPLGGTVSGPRPRAAGRCVCCQA